MARVSSVTQGFDSSLPTLLTSRPRVQPSSPKRGRQPFVCSEIKLPEEIEACPPTLRIRNTFLDTEEQRPPSLEPFFRERIVQTCPGQRVGLLDGLFREGTHTAGVATPAMSSSQTPIAELPSPTPFMPAAPFPNAAQPCTVVSLAAMLDLPSGAAIASIPMQAAPMGAAPMGALPLYFPPMAPPQLLPAGHDLPPTPAPPSAAALGSDELPSVGSALHASGECKPCAFLYTKGCENGVNCTFCHLCDADERKRRRKAKMEAQAMRREKLRAAALAEDK